MTALTDNLQLVATEASLTTLASPGKAVGATTITITSAAGWPTLTGFTFAIRSVDASGTEIAGTYTEWIGTLSGTTITLGATPSPVFGEDQQYSAGATTQVYIPVSAYSHNLLITAILQSMNQDGSLVPASVAAAIGSGVIIPSMLETGAPSTWPWVTDTPSFTGITVEDGTVTAAHTQVGKIVIGRVLLVFGASTTLPTGADSFVTLPVTARDSVYDNNVPLGQLLMRITGSFFQGFTTFHDVNDVLLQAYAVDGTTIRSQAVDTTNLGLPGDGDYLFYTYIYEAA